MKYHKLGRTNLNVSEVALGCEGLMKKSEAEVKEFINECESMGVNFIDFYSPNPDARISFGKAIKGKRDKWVIESHLCAFWENDQYLRTRDINKVKQGFDDMLKQMDVDYIDVGMIHYVDGQDDYNEVFNGEVIKYAQELKEKGLIKSIGLSSHNPLVAMQAVKTGLIDVLLFSINPCYDMQPASEVVDDLWADEHYEKPLTNIDPDRQALYEYCEANDIAITVMKAFGGGDLLDASLSPFKVAMSVNQCIHYCLTRPGVVAVMAGGHTIDEVKKSVAYEQATNEEKDFTEVLASLDKHSFKENCVYCGHCAPCVKGIDVASVNKFTDLCVAQGEVPETVREHYKELKHHASECIKCGRCMKNCPFKVNIISKMEQAVDIFGY